MNTVIGMGTSIAALVIARSEATKQSILSLRGEMDCFASLAMTAHITPRSRRACARVLLETSRPKDRGRRECRALGAPAASRVVKNTRVSHHGHTGNTRHSPRNGFNGLLRALPGDRACLSPSPAELPPPT